MTQPDRNNPYSFNEFLEARNSIDYYRDDPFFQRVLEHFAGKEWEEIDREARKFSPRVSFRWRDMADSAARPEKRPFIHHYDGHNNRIDRIVRPHEVEVMEKEVFSEGVLSSRTSPWMKLMKMYLLYQNGEACISCPLVCTEGLVAILDRFADTPETKHILKHCKEGIDGDFGIGAQYLSEIQGGSDVAANVLEAVQDKEGWKLYGTKFFCSATHADYAVVTGKPAGSEKVALFVIPSWLPGNKEREIRNGYTIDRLKWKMGTSELTTAELTFNGAVAYPVGPLERGLANVVGIVLAFSRLTVGLAAAAGMARGAREAKLYSQFREAFGLKIGQFPMLARQVQELELYAQRTTAGSFKLYHQFLDIGAELKGGLSSDEPMEKRKKRFNVRELIMLQKITAAWDSTDQARYAMSVFGGHGVMEDFSSIPRLYRDAAVNELWEGPRNVLLMQIHRDLQRAAEWYGPAEFVESVLAGSDPEIIADLGKEMEEIVSLPNLLQMDEETMRACERWDRLCHRLCHEYQNQALREVMESKPVPVESTA